MSAKTRIFLVDDHTILRQGMRRLLELEKDFEVCGEAAEAQEALKNIGSSKAQIALVDVGLKGMGGLELVKMLKDRFPKLMILVMSMFEESLYAERALRAGARGYIMKHEAGEEVLRALRRVVAGKTYLSPAMSERMLERLGASDSALSPVEILSDRELEVFRLIGQGHKPAAIAEQLHLSVKTIETYREQIKAKLQLKNAAELSQFAIAWSRTEGS